MRTVVFAAVLVAAIVPILIILYSQLVMYRNNLYKTRFDNIRTNTDMIINVINSTGFINNQEGSSAHEEINALADYCNGRIVVVDKNLTILEDTYNNGLGKSCISAEVIKCLKSAKEVDISNGKKDVNEIIMPIINTDRELSGAIIVAYSNGDINETIAFVARNSLALGVCIIVVIGMFGFFVAVKISSSVNKVESSVNEISQGYLDKEISVDDFMETDRLSQSLNTMCSSIQRLENSRQEFVSNVSHELKTPITSMKVLADSLIAQEEVPNELYKEFMQDIAAEIDRETKIINDLLSLVRMDKSSAQLNIEQVNINELIEMLLKRLRPLAAQRNIEIVLESFRPVVAEIDETKLSLALSNLIENAIKYNYEDGWIRVSLNADHKYFYVRVADSGVGIPQDCIDSVFERFYRVDKARSRETGGTGLGLAITRNVILMHKGAIKLHSKEKEGTTFTVRIPLTYSNNPKA